MNRRPSDSLLLALALLEAARDRCSDVDALLNLTDPSELRDLVQALLVAATTDVGRLDPAEVRARLLAFEDQLPAPSAEPAQTYRVVGGCGHGRLVLGADGHGRLVVGGKHGRVTLEEAG